MKLAWSLPYFYISAGANSAKSSQGSSCPSLLENKFRLVNNNNRNHTDYNVLIYYLLIDSNSDKGQFVLHSTMNITLAGSIPWHEGEKHMHKAMRAPYEENPTTPLLSPGASGLAQTSPLIAVGALDKDGRPWTSLWGGQRGFSAPISESILGIKTTVDARFDPVVDVFFGESGMGNIVKEEGEPRPVSGLAIDMENRRRVKLMGHFLGGVLEAFDIENFGVEKQASDVSTDGIAQVQFVASIDGSLGTMRCLIVFGFELTASDLGNCPKYINRKEIIPVVPQPKLVSDSPQLAQGALELLNQADTLFLSSSHQKQSMDTNIRGGHRGFVRVISNDEDGAVIIYPEYSGNRLYQSLGNLHVTPQAGFLFPDFETGNVLYLTGETEILVGKDASKLLPKSNLAVKVSIKAARYVENGLPFRGSPGQASPYNPKVRYLTSEKETPGTQFQEDNNIPVSLIKNEPITPTISRFRFRITDPAFADTWLPGQYVALSFAEELDMGYSHMKEDDPTSINDDFIRTFTISSHPQKLAKNEFEITARKNGSATTLLFRSTERSMLDLSMRGFGGDLQFKRSPEDAVGLNGGVVIPFVAGGIGITPLLGQLPDIDISQLRLLWSISISDIGLAHDVFDQFPELPKSTALFVTRSEQLESKLSDGDKAKLESVLGSGTQVYRRRMGKEDTDAVPDTPVWYLCADSGLKAAALNFLTGKQVLSEDFFY